MTRPTGEEFGDAGKLESLGFADESLFGVEIRRAGTRIDFRQFRIAVRGGEAKGERGHDTKPHRLTRHWRAIEGLDLKGEPEECTGRNERHRIHRKPR